MEDGNRVHPVMESEEEIPDEYQCCVCLDLLYKPVVLACGHISCFWCVFRAMNFWQESRCPVCRHSYNHFPAICQLLHFLLLKLYPIAYKSREKQVLEEEKRSEQFSPQLDYYVSGSETGKELNIHSNASPNSIDSVCNKSSVEEREPSVVDHSSENTTVSRSDDETLTSPKSTSETPASIVSGESIMLADNTNLNSNHVLIADLLCTMCKKLLCRPVVLNCGHVYCEACITTSGDKVPRCQDCQSVHPNGFPKVCLVLEHFLEERFSEQYALRKEAVSKQEDSPNSNLPACSTKAGKDVTELLSRPSNAYLSWWSGQGPKVHIGAGCDYCGMCPIIGERYRCKDCKEKIGFDLCEGCYKSSSKLPGRFNQQHTADHKLEIVTPTSIVNNLMMTLEGEESEEEEEEDDESDASETMEDVGPNLSSEDSRHDIENGLAAPNPPDSSLNDEEGSSSSTL